MRALRKWLELLLAPMIAYVLTCASLLAEELKETAVFQIDQFSAWTASFSPDNKDLACGGWTKGPAGKRNGEVHIWDVTKKTEKAALRGHADYVQCLAYSPNGGYLATGSGDGVVKVWDLKTFREVLSDNVHLRCVTFLAFLPDNNTIVSGGSEGQLKVWKRCSGKSGSSIDVKNEGITCGALSNDGKMIVVGGMDKTLSLIEVVSGAERARLKGYSQGIADVALLPNGSLIVSLEGEKGELRFWNLDKAKEVPSPKFGKRTWIMSLGFSPDGKYLALGERYALVLWDVSLGKTISSVRSESLAFSKVIAFSPDGRLLAAGGDKTVGLWEVPVQHDAVRTTQGKLSSAPLQKETLILASQELANLDAKVAFRAMVLLVNDPEQSLPILREGLAPASEVPFNKIQKWIAALDDRDFMVREDATHQLELLADLAEPQLTRLISAQASLEARTRAQRLLERLNQPTSDPKMLWQLRAIEILERIGSRQSKEILTRLTRGAPAARVTKEAEASLERLRKTAHSKSR